MANNVSLYTIDEKGWRYYHIEKLEKKQCDIVAESTKQEASSERYKAIGFALGAIVTAIAIVVISIVTAKIVTPFFFGIAIEIGVIAGVNIPEAILFSTKVVSYTMHYIFGLMALKKLCDKSYFHVIDHWQYAKELEQQAVNATLQKAKLENASSEN